MSRLLVTQLPQEIDGVVSSDTYNRLVRILEINLGEFDPDNIRQIEDTEKAKVWSGSYWLTLSTPQSDHGLSATGSVGEVSVKLAGATTITL